NALRPLPAAPAPHGGASSGGYPSPSSSAPGHLYSVGDSTSVLVATRKKRAFVIAASAAAAVVLGIVLLIVFGLGDTPKPAANGPSAPVLAPSPDAAQPAITDAAVLPDPQRVRATGAPADAAPARSECVVEISSLPTGAEVVRGKEVVGTTPTKLTLPCGQEAKLVVRKGKFAGVTRAVTPIDAATVLKVKVALAKTLLSVKVTSSPPGATITSGGKSLGVTPAMIKLPALEPSTLVISKPGFTAETQKLTPKQNNQAVHVALKRRGR
ncbi:MAG TPA: PEGA domain-containing protein, partial [Kofleriaceae bacterium]|nr:PEGA domain-containing protein [Kofleriaceae bacterium]